MFCSRPLSHMLLAIILAGSTNAGTALAEVRLGRESGGDYTVKVMTWWDIPFRSVVRQRFDFSCGSAAIATLLSYHYDRNTPEITTFKQMWASGNRELIRKVGFSMYDMKAYLASIGYRAEGFRLTVEELQQVKRPLIVLLDMNGFKHFVVIKGMSKDRILLGDSVLGLTQYSHADFSKMWNGIALAIIRTPENHIGSYNLASDWGPWSKAPLEEGGDALGMSVGDLTTHLKPDYQLSPQILLDVHVGTVR